MSKKTKLAKTNFLKLVLKRKTRFSFVICSNPRSPDLVNLVVAMAWLRLGASMMAITFKILLIYPSIKLVLFTTCYIIFLSQYALSILTYLGHESFSHLPIRCGRMSPWYKGHSLLIKKSFKYIYPQESIPILYLNLKP